MAEEHKSITKWTQRPCSESSKTAGPLYYAADAQLALELHKALEKFLAVGGDASDEAQLTHWLMKLKGELDSDNPRWTTLKGLLKQVRARGEKALIFAATPMMITLVPRTILSSQSQFRTQMQRARARAREPLLDLVQSSNL